METLGQLFIIGLSGPKLTDTEKQFIIKNDIGGVILFDRNIESPKQLHGLCSEIQSLRHQTLSKAPFFISIDMEGGRVARLKAPFTQWPPMRQLGDIDSTSLTFKFALSMGEELRAVGINLNYSPCVDVLTNSDNQIIGDRALSTDPEMVAKQSSALVRGFIKSGILPCAKHFPGHGNTLLDSHEDLPVEDIDKETLMAREIIPFKKAFRARLDLVMTAHIKYSKLDNEAPATLSKTILTDLLRNELRYRGLVMSDDLGMKALTKFYSTEQIPVMALDAGVDILLYCNELDNPPIGLEAVRKAIKDNCLKASELENRSKNVLSLKQTKLKEPDPAPFEESSKSIGHPEHLRISKAIDEGEVPEDLQT